jgi:hypothetical protein
MIDYDRYITRAEEREQKEASMDLDIITTLKQKVTALISDAAKRLNNPEGNEPSHDSIIDIMQGIDEAFYATIRNAEERSGELYKWSE